MMGGLDQFYTCPDVASHCWGVLKRKARRMVDWDTAWFMEPSAGTGVFLERMPAERRRGYDLAPRHVEVRYADFLTANVCVNCLEREGRQWVVVGNPPFGFASHTAVRFFNKAAQLADVIAFIVPRTFRKASVQNRLARWFVLRHDEDTPEYSFLYEGKPHDVPCAFQIWQRTKKLRPLRKHVDVSEWIRYVKEQQLADFALRRVGGRAGQVLPLRLGVRYSPTSTYFIRDICGWAQEVLEATDWSTVRDNTAGVRSVSKLEVAEALVRGARP